MLMLQALRFGMPIDPVSKNPVDLVSSCYDCLADHDLPRMSNGHGSQAVVRLPSGRATKTPDILRLASQRCSLMRIKANTPRRALPELLELLEAVTTARTHSSTDSKRSRKRIVQVQSIAQDPPEIRAARIVLRVRIRMRSVCRRPIEQDQLRKQQHDCDCHIPLVI